jgi:hypothetical protein
MSSINVRDLDGFYNKMARSIWTKEPLEVISKSFLLVTKMSQQIMYERQVVRGKQAAVWNAIDNSVVIKDIMAVCHSISFLFYSYSNISGFTDRSVHHEVTVILSRWMKTRFIQKLLNLSLMEVAHWVKFWKMNFQMTRLKL